MADAPVMGASYVTGPLQSPCHTCYKGDLQPMLLKMARLIFIFCLIFASSAQATIYRWINAQGNVVFSDAPPPSGKAEKLHLGNSLDTIHTPSVPTVPATSPTAEHARTTTSYQSLVITSPSNNQSIRANNGDINVSLSLSPALKSGDQIRLFMDGAQVYSGTNTQITLHNIDRGTHTLYAVVESQNGSVAIRSAGISFSLQRYSILFEPQKNSAHDSTIHQAPRAPMMPRAPHFHYPD